MWKITVGFAIFAGLALFILSKGGDYDMDGEKHGADAMHVPETAASPVVVPAVVAAPASAASAPASAASVSKP